jgi:hypothetical protein
MDVNSCYIGFEASAAAEGKTRSIAVTATGLSGPTWS